MTPELGKATKMREGMGMAIDVIANRTLHTYTVREGIWPGLAKVLVHSAA